MDLIISILNWNTTDLLPRCLNAVKEHDTGIQYEVIISDNASTDTDVRQVAEGFPEFKWFFNHENNGSLAFNQALRDTQGRYVLFLGADTQIQTGCLQAMVHFLDTRPEVGAVSAKLLNPDGSTQRYYRKFPDPLTIFFARTRLGAKMDAKLFRQRFTRTYLYEDLDLESNLPIEVQQPAVACLMMRSELAWENDYVVDPRFPNYFADVDHCKRVYEAGYKIFMLPNAKVLHPAGHSTGKREAVWIYCEMLASTLNYLRKYHRRWVWIFYIYFVSEIALGLAFNYAKLVLASRNEQYYRRTAQDLWRILRSVTRPEHI